MNYPDELSGGQKTRVSLGRLLLSRPDIILLDEPTNHLDVKHQLELMDYLNKWSSDDSHSVIGVMHDINLALRLTENIILMKDGHFVYAGNFNDINDADIFRDVYDADIAGFMKESYEKWKDK